MSVDLQWKKKEALVVRLSKLAAELVLRLGPMCAMATDMQAAMPLDVRKGFAFPSKVQNHYRGSAPSLLRGLASQKPSEKTFRKAGGFPHIRRQSRRLILTNAV
jgi:hypothetical protein